MKIKFLIILVPHGRPPPDRMVRGTDAETGCHVIMVVVYVAEPDRPASAANDDTERERAA